MTGLLGRNSSAGDPTSGHMWTPANMALPSPDGRPHDSRGPTIIAIQVSATAIVLTVVLLRLYTRKYIIGAVGLDDWLMAATTLLLIGTCVGVVLVCVRYQGGSHLWDIRPQNVFTIYKAFWAMSVLYIATITMTRFSVLASYLRLFGTIRTFRIITIVTIVANLSLGISTIIALFLSCRPLSLAWNPLVQITGSSQCLNRNFPIIVAVLSILMDFWVWFIPLKPLWNLSLPLSQKIITGLLLSMGAMACIASILRLRARQRSLFASRSTDPFYDAFEFVLYTILEENLAAIAASVPALKALIQRRWPNFLRTSRALSGWGNGQLRTSSRTAASGTANSTTVAAHDDADLENGARDKEAARPESSVF